MTKYPTEWKEIAKSVKDLAGWRCIRCRHPHETPNSLVKCDHLCREDLHPETWELIPLRRQRILTVHHMDGRKSNLAHWNLAALCQVCHLFIQGTTQHRLDVFYVRGPWLALEHWVLPFRNEWIFAQGEGVLHANYEPPDNWGYDIFRYSLGREPSIEEGTSR